jgi:hypothetical protein
MELKDLTPEQKAALRAEMEAEEKTKVAQLQQQKDDYKKLVDEFVRSNVKKLQNLSSEMMRVKNDVFSDSETLVTLKNELFKVKGDRRSDTLSTLDGRMTIILGHRTYEGWDDTVDAGIDIVREYMKSLAKDDNSAALVETIMRLLAKDSKGNLKASKVLELEKLAAKTMDARFLEGIAIIKAAYRSMPSCQFIEATVRDENGNEENIPLSLSALKNK